MRPNEQLRRRLLLMARRSLIPQIWVAPGFLSSARSPPTVSASRVSTATATAITRPWFLSTIRVAPPFALLNVDDDGGEQAATHDLMERGDIRSKIITLDALHTTRKTARLIRTARITSSSSRATRRRPLPSLRASTGRETPPAISRRNSPRRTADWSST